MKATIYITGSIAAYKAINVVRNFQKKGLLTRLTKSLKTTLPKTSQLITIVIVE